MDRVDVGGSGYVLSYFRTHDLRAPHPDVTRVVVVLHGTGRDAADYFDRMVTVADEEGALATTAVIAPRFQTDPATVCSGLTDTPAPEELTFSCSGWKHGANALNAPSIDSFAALDALVVAAVGVFPNLERVTIAGHSAGGQVAHRYAAVNGLDGGSVTVPFRYVVMNPSSYLYFDDRRLASSAVCSAATNCALDAASFVSPYFDAAACAGYDEYPYGLALRYGASARVSAATMVNRYLTRDVVQMLGDLDSDASTTAGYADLDVSCEAMAQGPSGASFRLQRGLAYNAYVGLSGASHPVDVVVGCGHSKTCMFESSAGRARVFGL